MEIKRCYDTIIGASVGENQLVQNGDFSNGTTGWSKGNTSSWEVTADGIDVTVTQADNLLLKEFSYLPHKYVCLVALKTTTATTNVGIRFGRSPYQWKGCEATTSRQVVAGIFSITETYNDYIRFPDLRSSGWDKVHFYSISIIDLTALLGTSIADYIYSLETATAGSGISKLREWGFLRGYQAFNSGSLESVEVTGKVVRGFNQVDASTAKDNTYVTGFTGVEVSNDEFACTGYVKCMPSTAYYTNADTNVRIATIVFFDADKNPAGYASASNAVFTTPANAYYIRANVIKARMSVSELVINLSSDRNGEYEPYTERTYDYGDDTLRGIFKLDANNNLYADGDVKTSDGTITRKYVERTLNGSESYSISIGTDRNRISWEGYVSVGKLNGTFISDKLTTVENSTGGYGTAEWQIYGSTAAPRMWITVPSSIATANDFKTYVAQNPITVVYELATPTTEQGDPFPSPQVCYPDGTEEYITGNGVPVGHETRYEL